MAYNRTIFKMMRDLQSTTELKDYPKRVLQSFIAFIESGCFVSSENDKFICKNWQLGYDVLAMKWNSSHKKDKSSATFRSQTRYLSDKLYRMLQLDDVSLNDAFVLENLEVLKILEELGTLYRYADGETFFQTPEEYLDGYSTDMEFDLKDCETELMVINQFNTVGMSRVLSNCDKDKLSFVLQRVRAPLFIESSERYEVPGKRDQYKQSITVNDYKLSTLAYLNVRDTKYGVLMSAKAEECFDKFLEKSEGKLNEALADTFLVNTYEDLLKNGVSSYEDFIQRYFPKNDKIKAASLKMALLRLLCRKEEL